MRSPYSKSRDLRFFVLAKPRSVSLDCAAGVYHRMRTPRSGMNAVDAFAQISKLVFDFGWTNIVWGNNEYIQVNHVGKRK